MVAWSAAKTARQVSVGSVGLLAGAALFGALAPAAATTAGPAMLVIAAVLSLPHGAVDHLALGWARGRIGPARTGVLVGYAFAALVAAGVALAAPLPALLVLLALSAAHFGEGEAAFDRLRGGAGLALPAAALGLAVVALPLVLRPAAVRPLLVGLDPGLPAVLSAVRLPLLLLTGVLVVFGLAVALRAGQRRPAVELALTVLASLIGPPLLVFAVWFGGWHAPRHLVRLLELEPSGDRAERCARLARGAIAPTLVALAALGVIAALRAGLPGAVLVVLLALTVPHAVVVARIDRLRGRKGGPVKAHLLSGRAD